MRADGGPTGRRLRAAAVVALLVLLSTVPGVATAAPTTPSSTTDDDRSVDDLRDELEQTDRAIDDVEEELAQTRDEIRLVAEQVRESDVTLARYEAELTSLEAQLVAAEQSAATAAARTRDTRAELRELDDRLEATEALLVLKQELLGDRARSAFMYGEPTVADAVASSRSVRDLVSTRYYMRTVMLSDVDVVGDVDRLRRDLVDARIDWDRLRERVELQQLAADQARTELVDLTEAQTVLTALAADERARRTALLRRLQLHAVDTEAQLVELEQESSALEEELREVAWQAGAPGGGSWVWPTSGQLTSPFGFRTHPIWGGRRLHAGIDIGAGSGQEIVAANTGLVLTASCSSGGYGCRIVIDHGGGLASLYAHQSSFAVAPGEVVTAGQAIGYVGSTGASTGPHLHFEVRVRGEPTDPMQYVR